MSQPDPAQPPATPATPVAPPATPVEAETAPPSQAEPSADSTLGEAGKKALDSEREARKAAEKQARELAKKVAEFEDRDKSETQRLTDAAAAAEQRAKDAERRYLQQKVAIDKGLPLDVVDMLTGDDEDAMSTQADRLVALRAAAAPGPGSADQGAKPPVPNDLPTQIKAAEQAGDYRLAMELKNRQAAAMITTT